MLYNFDPYQDKTSAKCRLCIKPGIQERGTECGEREE